MSYGLKYQSRFDSFQPLLTYQLLIYAKNYDGSAIDLILSGNPAIHEWQDDDPKAPIKGSTLKVSILTQQSGVQLTDFYSEDDYGFGCELRRMETDELLFQGYLLQDDSQELQVDFTHEIQLTFTDGLGLLKDVTLDQASVIVGSPNTYTNIDVEDISLGGAPRIASANTAVTVLKPGDAFSITYSSVTYDFVCLNVTFDALFGYIIWVDRLVTIPSGLITVNLTFTAPYPLVGYIPLIDIYMLCLKSTYIDTGLNCYTRLYPVGGTNERLLDDTFIQVETFLNNGEWMNCYDILEQINSRFNLSLFQAKGTWNLMRWDELYRYTTDAGATLQYHVYSSSFVYSATNTSNEVWTFKKGNDMEVGVLKSVNRANQFVKETFNYNETILLLNENLQELGPLLAQYDVGTNTYYEYELPYWIFYTGNTTNPVNKFIRVIKDIDNVEIERFIVITEPAAQTYPYLALQSNDIYVSAGDKISFNFDFKTKDPISGFASLMCGVTLTNGIDSYYQDKNGIWQTFVAYADLPQILIQSGDSTGEWHTFTINSYTMPIEGKLNVYLFTPTYYAPSYDEIYFKNLQFNIITFLAGWGNIIGHTHTDTQSLEIKNNIEKEIFIDTSPRRTIKGSLFLNTYTGFLINRTTKWIYPGASYDYSNLGEGTTKEALFTTYKMRSKYEGKYLFINQEDVMLNNLAVFVDNQNYNFFRYAPGKMSIDYKNGHADLSLWEIIDSPDGDFEPGGAGITFAFTVFANSKLYEFNYLYEKY